MENKRVEVVGEVGEWKGNEGWDITGREGKWMK